MALWRTRQRAHPANIELRTAMLDRTHPAGVDVNTAVPVGEHGVGRPAVPELTGHSDELLGPLVAVGVVEKATALEVLAGERVRRRDDVPAGPTVGQMVERGELPCHLEGFVECGVDGACQAEVVGDGGERRQHSEGVGPADDVEIGDAAAVLTQPQTFGEEEEVEQTTLRGAGHVHERVELDLAARLRVRPHRGVVDAGEVGGEVNRLAVLSFSDGGHQIPQRLAMSSWDRSRSARRCVTEVMTSSSAPVTRCSVSSRSATSSASPTNCVAVRSLTTSNCSSVRGSALSGSG